MKLFKIDVTGVTGASMSKSTLGKPVKVRREVHYQSLLISLTGINNADRVDGFLPVH